MRVTHPDADPRPDSTHERERAASPLAQVLARFGRAALALIYPPQCIACNRATGEAHALCAHCWAAMPFLSDPVCARLGTPFAHDFGPGMLSPAAIADPPRFDSARAAALHEGAAKAMVARLKYGERPELARAMAGLMVQAGAPLVAGADWLIPVPMHRGRLWQRRYNQATLLAGAIGALAGKPFLPDTLQRVKPTRPQVGLSRNERRHNLAGAFRIEPGKRAMIEGQRCLLIDDVRTTGSTLNACAHILRQAGAARIDALTFTLVPDGG